MVYYCFSKSGYICVGMLPQEEAFQKFMQQSVHTTSQDICKDLASFYILLLVQINCGFQFIISHGHWSTFTSLTIPHSNQHMV